MKFKAFTQAGYGHHQLDTEDFYNATSAAKNKPNKYFKACNMTSKYWYYVEASNS